VFTTKERGVQLKLPHLVTFSMDSFYTKKVLCDSTWQGERDSLAEAVNGAILAHQGAPPDSPLERLTRQVSPAFVFVVS